MTRRGRALGGLAVLAVAAALGLRAYDRPPAPPGEWLRKAGLEERFATIGGHRVRYVRTGRGPAVLLLHGFGSSLYTWKDVIPALAGEREVVAFDFPGFGWSDLPPDLTFEVFPRVALGLLEELGLAKASLVGNSMGGAVASLVAAEHPSRVDRLVLIDAAGFNFQDQDRPRLFRLATHPYAEPLMNALPLRRLFVERGLAQVFHDPVKIGPERIEEYLAAASRPGALAGLRSLGESFRTPPKDFEATLRLIRAPTLVIWGAEDGWIPAAHGDRFAAAIAKARQERLSGVGHVPQEEDPASVSRLLREFLAEGPSS